MGDTSDYETDPYSQSDPISVNHHSRTNSAAAAGKELRSKANSISVLSQDSGMHYVIQYLCAGFD